MMKCLYLLSVVFHIAAGCDLSGDNQTEITGHKGGSVLVPCSCSDLHNKPQKFTWWSYRTGPATEMLNDEHYRGRLQLFNHVSPGNLSLLISDLREEDEVDYWCKTEKEHRDITLHVKVGIRETSTHSRKTDTTSPSEPPQSTTTNSPPASSSTTLEQDKQQTQSSLPLGCALSADNPGQITGHKGDSVLLPCSCSDLHSKPQIFTWRSYRTGHPTEVLNDERYRGRLQLFNHISPANLSLLISDLREEDQGVYRCNAEKEPRDIWLFIKGRRETSTHSKKPDTTTPSEPPQSKTTNSPPASSSTTLEQGKQETHSSLPLGAKTFHQQ
ncbi:uncharacterized protein LOC128620296 isoform X2 [Ictalurus furcatus]|uniref:uncharacterized protein LOC128620296 isoform X2 n=1 Tax=Ictalurus furcatus TaxID=66913 RepID=UPI0023509707|nr:uncharacterized protein LOC128620296 isoform X2 [Ictalurus furcatus]